MPKARILAVDDQLYFRSYLEGLLTEEGYQVETACSATDALHALERERFDVVVTDMVMPEMGGPELVHRIKEEHPDQEVVVLTGVGDVKTAVEAMKVGATDYLLKPIERAALLRTIDSILQRARLREEHARLMRENLKYMEVLSLYERVLSLFATLPMESLAERVIEGLCLETQAEGGVLWIAGEEDRRRLRLLAARGLVRPAEEQEELDAEHLPAAFGALSTGHEGTVLTSVPAGGPGGERPALLAPLRHAGHLIGIARLTDKLEGREFDDRDRATAEKFVQQAAVAVANARRFRSLERRSFRDPITKAYTLSYFEDVVRNEIQKAARFGRTFAVLSLELDPLGPLRQRMSEPELGRWLEGVVFQVGRALRSTDLVAAEGESRYRALLPETDALGAAVLKRRIRDLVQSSEIVEELPPEERPRVLVAAASYPSDGTQLDGLASVLEERLEEERASPVRALEHEETGESFAGAVDALLAHASPGRRETAEQAMRFLIDEVGRRPQDRGLLFVAPGAGLSSAVTDALERLRGLAPRTEVVFVGDGKAEILAGAPVTCVSARRAGTRAPFLIYYREGPAYALVREPAEGGDGTPLFHTSDRPLVEHLAFQLQRDLGIALGV